MIDVILEEHHDRLPVFHKSLRVLVHTVHKHLVIEAFLHLRDIDDASVGQLLELGIADVGAVHCRYLIEGVMARSEHERVVCRGRRELHVAWYALIGVYHRVDFDTAFLLARLQRARLQMASDTLENGVGEQACGR